MAGIYVLLVCYTLVVMVPLAAQCELIMAYSIQRHGARNVLPKSAVLTESDASGGPTLLPAGQQMCFEAGEVGGEGVGMILPDLATGSPACNQLSNLQITMSV